MNMQSLMAQAQKVQRELEAANKEIESTTFVGENDAIKVEVKAGLIQKIEIKDDSILQDKELVQDMLLVAANKAFNEMTKVKNEKLGKYTGGLGGLF